tara:strand:+ start:5878 stop:6258 length:381 start_codon:yes stop_codon:yes gene_type:complete
MRIDDAITGYIRLRDKKEKMQRQHKDELVGIVESMQKVEAWLMREFNSQGITESKNGVGSAFIQNNDSCTVQDREGFLEFCKESDNYELMDIRASKPVIRAYMENFKEIPTGIKYTQRDVIRIRRK